MTITATGSVDVDALYTLNLSATDPGDDTIIGWTINWGDGAIETVAGNPPSVTHVYTQAGFTRNITVSARDEDGSWTNSDLIVGNYRNNSDDVFASTERPGVFELDTSPSRTNLDRPYYAVVGPDGNYYAAASDTNKIVRFDPSGTYLDDFVTAGLGGLFGPGGMAFGPDGSLFVASFYRDEILRYDASGSFTGVLASGGGLDGPAGLAFGPDGDLYMASWNNGRLLVDGGANGGTPSTGSQPVSAIPNRWSSTTRGSCTSPPGPATP